MRYSADKLSGIDLGRQGENLARTIEIDVSSLLAQWPEAVISLMEGYRTKSAVLRIVKENRLNQQLVHKSFHIFYLHGNHREPPAGNNKVSFIVYRELQ